MDYVGAFVKAFENSDGDVVAIAESKSTFLTGTYDADDEEFTVGDTVYTLKAGNIKTGEKTSGASPADIPVKVLKNMAVVKADKTIAIDNGKKDADATGCAKALDEDAAGNAVNTGESNFFATDATTTGTITIAANVSGKSIKNVYSVSKWVADDAFYFEKDMLEDDNINDHDFDTDSAKKIDTNTFILNGVSALSEIKENNIVEVFENNGTVVRVDVCDKTVSGKITIVDGDDYTIAGKVYSAADKFADNQNDTSMGSAGDKGTAYLNYRGDVAGWDTEDASTDNYAIVSHVAYTNGKNIMISLVDKTGKENDYAFKDDIDYYATPASQVKNVTVAGSNSGYTGGISDDVNGLTKGTLVTFSLDSNNKVKEITKYTTTSENNKELNKNRTLYANKTLDSGLVIFTYDGSTLADSDFDVIKLSDLETEKTLNGTYYYADPKVKVMIVDDKYTGADSTYAVINSVKEAVNDDDDDVYYVKGFKDGKEFTAYTSDRDGKTVLNDAANATSETTGNAQSAVVVKLTFDSKGIITDVAKYDAADVDGNNPVVGAVAEKDGNYLIKIGDNWYTVDPSVTVYKYRTDGDFETGKINDVKATKGGVTGKTVSLYQTDDSKEVYDLVIIWD